MVRTRHKKYINTNLIRSYSSSAREVAVLGPRHHRYLTMRVSANYTITILHLYIIAANGTWAYPAKTGSIHLQAFISQHEVLEVLYRLLFLCSINETLLRLFVNLGLQKSQLALNPTTENKIQLSFSINAHKDFCPSGKPF